MGVDPIAKKVSKASADVGLSTQEAGDDSEAIR